MSAEKGKSKPEYTEDEKSAFVDTICEVYRSQHCTLESACNIAGISVRTFLLWRTQNAEFADRYKKAKEIQQAAYWEDMITPLVDSSLQRLLRGEKVTEKRTKVERNGQGETVITEQTITEKEILPTASVVIFTAKGVYPDKFGDKTRVEGEINVTGDTSWFAQLPFEQQLEILRIKNAAAQSGTTSGD